MKCHRDDAVTDFTYTDGITGGALGETTDLNYVTVNVFKYGPLLVNGSGYLGIHVGHGIDACSD